MKLPNMRSFDAENIAPNLRKFSANDETKSSSESLTAFPFVNLRLTKLLYAKLVLDGKRDPNLRLADGR